MDQTKNVRTWEMEPVKLKDFEGPLDLLLYLLSRNKVSIYDIPIATITDQYMEYIYGIEEIDMEVASSFIVVAATLMQIKTKMMLPKDDDDEEEDPRDELARSLELYRMYKEASVTMKERADKYFGRLSKSPQIIVRATVWDDSALTSDKLVYAWNAIFERETARIAMENKHDEKIVVKEKFSLRKVLRDVIRKITNNGRFSFTKQYSVKKCSGSEVVTAFMAILELARIRKVSIEQNKLFGEIYVSSKINEKDGLDDTTFSSTDNYFWEET